MSKLGILLALVTFNAISAEVPSIKVWSPDFSESHIFEDPKTISSITTIWSNSKQEYELKLKALGSDLYKIDFSSALPNGNSRWLYHKAGYFRLLSKSSTQVFKVPNPEKLNELLKI